MLWDTGECPTCGDATYGLLDEARVSLPFPAGAFQGRTALCANLLPMGGGGFHSGNMGPHAADGTRYHTYTPYMVIQDIVRSGMFSDDQLLAARYERCSSLYFSRHELEVNARAFKAIRPITCSCTGWGTPTMSDEGEEFNLPVDPGADVERDFVSGNPVRTGFRLRSPEARKRRARRKKMRRSATVSPDHVLVSSSLPAPAEVYIHLTFKYIPHDGDLRLYKSRVKVPKGTDKKPSFARASVRRKLLPRRPRPLKEHTKYWYFLRKTGKFRLSEHHPLEGDHLYLRWGFRKDPWIHRKGGITPPGASTPSPGVLVGK